MSRFTLLSGAATLTILAFYFKIESHLSVALGLMWIAMSIKKGNK